MFHNFDAINFCRDWNDGMSVVDLSSKYNISKAQVRGRVNAWRKKGVALVERRGATYSNLTEKEVAVLNKELK